MKTKSLKSVPGDCISDQSLQRSHKGQEVVVIKLQRAQWILVDN